MEHKPIAIMILSVFVIGILMLGTLAATVNAQESSNTGTEHVGVVSGANQQSVLNIHNRERAAVQVPALVWSGSLAADALGYLHQLLAQNEGLVWDPQPQIPHDPAKPSTQGENIAYFTRAATPDPPKAPSLERLVEGWAAEKSNYHGGPLTDADFAPGIPSEKQMGHYTQMVWKDTKQVGCAAAIVRGMTQDNWHSVGSYLVCRYSPTGNYLGQSPY